MIPLVKTYVAPKEVMMPEIEKILYSGYIAVGSATEQFENKFAAALNIENCVAVNSGTAALHIALDMLGVEKGDEVISTAMTAEPTNTVIAQTGATVVWGDINPKTGLLDPSSVEEKITAKTKAIMLVHYAGMVCDMDAFNELSQRYGIPIIEDCAHALGAKYNGEFLGNVSPYTCYSFQAIKHMTTIDGGMLVVRNLEDVTEAKKKRFFGIDKSKSRLDADITSVGFKYGMNNVNATIGNVQLDYLSDIIGKHISNGKFYDLELEEISGVEKLVYSRNTDPSYWLYTMKVEGRDEFCKMMEANGVMASKLHHRSDTHSLFSLSKCDLPGLDEFYESFVHIPCGWWVNSEDREYIVELIKKGW